jgi:tetratricopeptide (TPR) repeat protein
LYREALRVEPAFLEGHHALGQYHAAIDQKDLALAAYEDALELNPGYYPVHFSMGMLLLDLGRSDEAELHFRRVVELDESNADAYYYLGNIQYSRRRFDWAQIQYELALAWQPDHVNAEYGFGKASQELGNLEEAFQRFDHVIEMAPRFPDGYFSRASVYSLREEYQLAVADYATTTLLGEREILLTESRIREAVGRGTAVARSDQRRLEDYKAHLEELLTYTGQNRTAIETYLRQVEEFRRARRTGSAQ